MRHNQHIIATCVGQGDLVICRIVIHVIAYVNRNFTITISAVKSLLATYLQVQGFEYTASVYVICRTERARRCFLIMHINRSIIVCGKLQFQLCQDNGSECYPTSHTSLTTLC